MYLEPIRIWLQVCHDYSSAQALIQLHHWHLYVTKQDHYGLLQQMVGDILPQEGLHDLYWWTPEVS